MLNINFGIFPTLATESLNLRQLGEGDAIAIYHLRKDREVMKHIGKPLAQSPDEMVALIHKYNDGFLNNEAINWGITLKNSKPLIGIIGFHRINKEHHRAEIGYLLMPQYQKMGLMHEAMKVVLHYGFYTLGLHSVEANVDEANRASVRLLEKNLFIKEAHFRENYYFDGRFLDSVIYSLVHHSS